MTRIALLLSLFVTIITSTSFADDEAMEQRVNYLTDMIEQLTHKNDLLQKKIDSLATDVDFRFKELETKKSVATVAPKSETADDKPASPVSANPKQVKSEFDQAYSLLKEQKYLEAEQALKEFLKHHPKSEYSGNAYYWLGESFMLRKKYNEAAINYIHSFNKFPQNSKADLSILKLATALNTLGKKKEACSTLAKLKLKKAELSPSMQKLLVKENSKIQCN